MKTCFFCSKTLFLLCFSLLTLLFHFWLTLIFDEDVKFEELMQTRSMLISSTCQQHFHKRKRRNLLRFADSNFFWCPVEGIALENTLYRLFLRFKGIKNEEDLQVLADIYGKTNLKEIVEEGLLLGGSNSSQEQISNEQLLIVAVAHPHARLVSIYEKNYKVYHHQQARKHKHKSFTFGRNFI